MELFVPAKAVFSYSVMISIFALKKMTVTFTFNLMLPNVSISSPLSIGT